MTKKHRVPKWVPCFVETVHAPSNSQIINEISQTEHAPSLQAKLYVVPCGQKFIKIESNRSNSTFCPICCYLSDFSRSDFLISFGASVPLSNRSAQPPINCRNVARRVSTHQIEYHANKKGGVATSLILLCISLTAEIYFCACFTITSCAPPSTIDVAETSVILPSSFSCFRFVTPQLHIVDFILPSVRSRFDLSEPAYGT